MLAAEGVADDVVHLFLATGSHASAALDASVEMNLHRRMRNVLGRLMPGTEARLADRELPRPQIELGIERVGRLRNV